MIPGWLSAWCQAHLGGEPVEVLFRLRQTSTVFGLRLADGTEVVVKARALAPIESSEAFLAAYQAFRGRPFTDGELEVAWAASVWTAAHNARWEALHGDAPVSGEAFGAQAAERLRLAAAY